MKMIGNMLRNLRGSSPMAFRPPFRPVRSGRPVRPAILHRVPGRRGSALASLSTVAALVAQAVRTGIPGAPPVRPGHPAALFAKPALAALQYPS